MRKRRAGKQRLTERSGLIRSGGRTEQIRRRVGRAARDMLARGDPELSIDELAERSGVHKSTIYRRWPQQSLLWREALSEHKRRLAVDYSGHWDRYLHRMARTFRDYFDNPMEIALCAALAATSDPAYVREVVASWGPITARLAQPLRAALARGEIRPGVDPQVLITCILGTIISQIVFSKEVPDNRFLRSMVDYLTAGVAAPGAVPAVHGRRRRRAGA